MPLAADQAGLRRDHATVEGRADYADDQGAGASRGRRLAALGERRRPGTALREDGSARHVEDPEAIAHEVRSCSSNGSRPPTCRARRPTRCGGVSRPRTTWPGPAAKRISPRKPKSAARTSRERSPCASRRKRSPTRRTGFETAEAIKKLQAEWKTIGPVSRGREKAIWDRFRAACDRFFTRRHEDLALEEGLGREPGEEGSAVREAEALAESTDWDQAAAEFRKLQAEWKTIGPVKKTSSEAIWQRFRGACDRFFAAPRAAARHRAGGTRRRSRGDLRRARSHLRRR